MLSTGIIRNVDELGRVVLPKELRYTLDISQKDSLEIFIDENRIIFKKYEPGCIFCGDVTDGTYYKGKNICKNCKREFNKE